MKRIGIFLAVLLLSVSALTGCAKRKTVAATDDRTVVRVGALKGATTMGMVKLIDDAEQGIGDTTYELTLAGSADELTPKLIKGELDIAAIPLNLAAILYGKSDGAIQLAAVNALGVLYIVETGEPTIAAWEDLRGQTIYATGKGSTPEYALDYLLSMHGMRLGTDVLVEWKSEPSEVVALMSAQEHAVAMLPQPYVTVAETKLDGLRVVLDLTASWAELDNGSAFVTAGLVVRRAFANEHPAILEAFLTEYAASSAFVNENPDKAAVLIEKFGIVNAPIAQKAIPHCNIVCITGKKMKDMANGCLKVLFDRNPAVVGGALPDEDFFYTPNP